MTTVSGFDTYRKSRVIVAIFVMICVLPHQGNFETILKLYGSCCRFSFVNNQCERRNCAILNESQALLSN